MRPFVLSGLFVCVAAAVALGVGCIRDLRSLAPFPCGSDNTCPTNFTCLDGQCFALCDAVLGCSDGQQCSPVAPPNPAGICYPTCGGTACPNGTSCTNGLCKPLAGGGGGVVDAAAGSTLDAGPMSGGAGTAPLGGACTPNGASCASPGVCTQDGICRLACATNSDCAVVGGGSECVVNFGVSGGQTYCTSTCQAVMGVGPGVATCPNGSKCVVVDWSASTTDCEFGSSSTTTCAASNGCAQGDSCYMKPMDAGVSMGTCYGNCYKNGSPCQFPQAGTCQVPAGGFWGVCCALGKTCL